jgi:ADP-ribosylglycohydrolase
MATYPVLPDFKQLASQLELYSQLKHEHGATGMEPILSKAEAALNAAVAALEALPVDEQLAQKEPNDLDAIKALRPAGPRRLWQSLDEEIYRERVHGALLGRFAGCTLGAPVEFWPIDRMRNLAKENGMPFPPQDYWTYVSEPFEKRYGMSPREMYTRHKMDGVPVDDDVTYTLLGLLILEDHGPDFTVADVGTAWVKYLPMACTAEKVALDNLRAGVPASEAGEKDNPYCEWIGGDIRSDPWGYLAPGWPEKAAELAYRDACISHRRQGIYGEMFVSAAISAAFAVDDPVEALKIGLREIPAECALAQALHWAFERAPKIKNYEQARAAMDEQFKGMSGVHTINNACLTVWGISMGRTDFTRVIGEVVAMGMDNDCTAATAGSIVGTVVGAKGIPPHWYKNFNDTVYSYMTGQPKFSISGLVDRFTAQAQRVWGG